MFFHAPTSAMATFSAAKAFSIARMRSASLRVAFGQYAALYPSRRCSRARLAGSSACRKTGPPRRTRVAPARIGRAAAAAPRQTRDRRVMSIGYSRPGLSETGPPGSLLQDSSAAVNLPPHAFVLSIGVKIESADFPPVTRPFMIVDAILAKVFGTKTE